MIPSPFGRRARRKAFDGDRLDARDPAFIAKLMPWFENVSRRYFRLQTSGFESLERGPVLYVGNHNGGIAGPDLMCAMASLWGALGPEHPLYALAHDFPMRQFTTFGAVIQQVGAIRASRTNALRALEAGAQVLVYPGGDLDAYRHFRRRNEVVLGPRTGFVSVAQAARVPIVPIVAWGAHRSAYIFTEGERLAQLLRLQRWARLSRFPLALALPWGLAAGPWLPYLPLPFAIRLRALAPMHVSPAEAPDVVQEEIRARMQRALLEMAGTSRTGA